VEIKTKRAYEPPEKEDGFRILVDRLWPRGLTKEKAKIDLWLKEVAPSNELRKWFGHEPEKWDGFRNKYSEELKGKEKELEGIAWKAKNGTVTLVYAAKDEKRNNAVALKEYIEAKL